MQTPTLIKIVVLTHWVLTIWGAQSVALFNTYAYTYMNLFIMACGMWCIVNQESTEPPTMYILVNLISIVMDIILLAIYTPRSPAPYSIDMRDEFRFSLGMAITNLILKPVTCIVMYKVLQERGSDINIPGLANLPPLGTSRPTNYENIDRSPSTTESRRIETAQPHQSFPIAAPSYSDQPYPQG